MDSQTLIQTAVYLVGLGVFVGITKSENKAVKESFLRIQNQFEDAKNALQRIEDKQDRANDEIVNLRERMAVVESELGLRNKNK